MSILRLLADTARIKNGKIEFEGTDRQQGGNDLHLPDADHH